MVGFKFIEGVSKNTNKPFYALKIHFTDKWYKIVFLTKKQYDCLQAVTISVTE